MSDDSSEYYDSYGNRLVCDWCGKKTKIRSLLMEGEDTRPYRSRGELLCQKCLNKEKYHLYLCQFAGRRIYCNRAYIEDNPWYSGLDRSKVIRTPKDHQDMARRTEERRQERWEKKRKEAARQAAPVSSERENKDKTNHAEKRKTNEEG